jgi:gliding motility-associated-like protein
MMQRTFLPIWVFFLFSAIIPLQSQSILLSFPDTMVLNGQNISLGLKVEEGFDEIVSMQFTINWNPDVISYQSFTEADLENVALGEIQADMGQLRFSWFDINGVGKTLPDESILVYLNFVVTGSTGDFTDLFINGQPLAIQIFSASEIPGIYEPVFLEQEIGTVTVVSGITVSSATGNVSCNGDSTGFIDLTLPDNPGNLNFSWVGPGNFMSDEEDLTDLAAGSYELTITNNEGDILLDTTFTLIEPDTPLAFDQFDTSNAGCDQNSGTAIFSGTGGGGGYTFNIGNGFVQDSSFSNLAAGDYSISLADSWGCVVVDSFSVDSVDLPVIDLGPPRVFCEGGSETLSVEGEYESYLWSTGEMTSEITVSEESEYSLIVTDEFGCTSADSVLVFVDSFPGVNELIIPVDGLCPGDSVEIVAQGGNQNEWIAPSSGTISNLFIPNPIVRPDTTTTYEVLIINECGETMASGEVVVYETTATAGPDTCIAVGTQAQLRASGGESYNWIGAEAPLSNTQVPDPFTQPQENATFIVSILDEFGCTTIDSVEVQVANDIENIKQINLISPNGDGKNDVLEFSGVTKFGTNSLKIYNRWGDLIYSKLNYQTDEERFDGTRNGNPLPAGTYYYILSLTDGDIRQSLLIVRE